MAVKKLKMHYKCIKLKTFLKIYRPPVTELFLRKLWCRILLCRELKDGKGRNGASGGSQKIKKTWRIFMNYARVDNVVKSRYSNCCHLHIIDLRLPSFHTLLLPWVILSFK